MIPTTRLLPRLPWGHHVLGGRPLLVVVAAAILAARGRLVRDDPARSLAQRA
jgi:hypothetical protein